MNRGWLHFILFSIFICFHSLGYAQSRAELEQNRKQIQEEIKTIRLLLSQTVSEEKSLLDQLNETNIQIQAQEKLIKALKDESNALNSEISANEKEIKKLTSELKELKEDYGEMIYKSYKSKSQNSRLMFLLSSENFYQAYKRLEYMKQYTSFRKAQGEQITKKAEVLEQKNDTLEIRKKEKQELAQKSELEQDKFEEKKQGQEEIIAQIKKKERKYKNELKKKQKDEQKIDDQIEKIIKDAIAKSNETSPTKSTSSSKFALTAEAKLIATEFEGNKGKLPWPVERGYVSRRFGQQKHPTLDGILIQSNGVRITTENGAKALAVFKGEVLQIQSVSGKMAVYIQHGNYITVYNNLESVAVQKGDEVDTKQVLGKVYTDKVTKKTILKFQIWKNTARLNPASWIYKM